MSIDAEHTLLGVQNMNALVLTFAKEERLNTFFQDSVFGQGDQMEPEDSDVVRWDEVALERHLAPVVGRTNPAQSQALHTVIVHQNAMAHILVSKVLDPTKLYLQRNFGELRANAPGYVARELRGLVKTIKNSIEYMCVNTLNGTLTVDSTTIPGSKVAFTLTYSPNTFTATSSWATDTTAHLDEIGLMKVDMLETAGLMPRWAITSRTVWEHLESSDQLTELLRNQRGQQIVQNGGPLMGDISSMIFDGGPGPGNLRWTINEAGYVPVGGSFTKFMPATDDLFLLPENDDLTDVLAMARGFGFLPSPNQVATVEGASRLLFPAPQRGFYSYAARTHNPGAIEIYAGWVGLPILKWPTGILVADVVP